MFGRVRVPEPYREPRTQERDNLAKEEMCMGLFLKYGTINGDSKEKGHEKWCDLESVQLGFQRGTGGRQDEIFITKFTDSASTSLFRASLFGEGVEAKIDFVATDPAKPYLQIKMTNTMISSYNVSNSGDRPMESLSLNYAKIEYGHNAASLPGAPPAHLVP